MFFPDQKLLADRVARMAHRVDSAYLAGQLREIDVTRTRGSLILNVAADDLIDLLMKRQPIQEETR